MFGNNSSAIDYSYGYYKPIIHIDYDRPVATTWHLSKIILYTGETIDFNYIASKPKINVSYNLFYQSNFNESFASLFASVDMIMPCLLKSIKCNTFSIDFSYENSVQKNYNRTFIPGIRDKDLFIEEFGPNPFLKSYTDIQWEQLSKININSNYEYIFRYSTSVNERLKLLSLEKRDILNQSVSKHEFKYNSGKLPDYWASHGDHQGFYNGRDHQYILKDNFFKYYREGDNYFLEKNIEKEYNESREVDKTTVFLKSEILEKIIYPTGGYTVFDYETHQVNRYMSLTNRNTMSENYNSRETVFPGGIRIKKISDFSETGIFCNAKSYYYVDNFDFQTKLGLNSGIVSSLPQYVQRIKAFYTIIGYNQTDYIKNFDLFSINGFNRFLYCKPGYHVGYSTVVESQENENGEINGYTEYKFTNFNSDIWGESHLDEMPLSILNETFHILLSVKGLGLSNVLNNYIPVSSKHVERGKLVSKKVFNKNGSLLSERLFKYKKTSNQSIGCIDFLISRRESVNENYGYERVAIGGSYRKFTYKYLLNEEYENNYLGQNEPFSIVKKYEYDFQNQLVKVEKILNKTETYTESYTYPYNYTSYPYTEMVLQNRTTPIVEKITMYNNKEIERIRTNYFKDPSKTKNLILPENIMSSTSGINNLRTDIIYNQYDTKGNIHQHTTFDGITTIYLWSYNGQYLIAEIKNATLTDTETAVKAIFSVSNIDALSVLQMPNEAKLRDGSLQRALPNAFVTTYTYKPFVGITSVTKPSGMATYYNYDVFGQLKEIYIVESGVKKIVQSFDYHFQSK